MLLSTKLLSAIALVTGLTVGHRYRRTVRPPRSR